MINPAILQTNPLNNGAILKYLTSEGIQAFTIIDLQDLNWIENDPQDFAANHSFIEITNKILTENCGFTKVPNFGIYEDIYELEGLMVSLGDYVNIHVDWVETNNNYFPSILCLEELFLHNLQDIFRFLKQKPLQIINPTTI